MTPLQIEIALHYHCCPGDYDPERLDAPAVKEALEGFVECGLLRRSTRSGQFYEGVNTPLTMYVEALCKVQLPELKWVQPA